MTNISRSLFMLIILFIMITFLGIHAEASTHSFNDSIEAAKQATVGILKHATESSYQTAHSQFAIRGSGVHLGEGYILTVRHAVERQEGGKTKIPESIHIITGSLAEISANLIGVNGFLDMALYRIDEKQNVDQLGSVSFADHESRQGDEVFTVGYPLGWGPALAFGQLGNPQTFLPTAQSRLMQVDLSACSGNSGGGLFNVSGKIVGLVQSIIQTAEKSEDRRCSRFSFSIPGTVIHKTVNALKTGKSPRFPKLGIRMSVVKDGQQWRVAVAKAKGPARKGGIRKNDILLAIDSMPITSAAQLKSYLIEKTKPGQVIELRVLRDTTEKVLKIILGKA